MPRTLCPAPRLAYLVAAAGALALAPGRAHTQSRPAAPAHDSATVSVDGRVALHALMSLGDAHLQKLADVLTLLARTDDARSASWSRIRGPLAAIAPMNVPAVHWFALPDGSYWTVEGGRASATLADRPYFPRVLSGRTVIGTLVESRSTRRNTAIVAVPVRGSAGTVVGVLGASVYLDSLSAILRAEMGGVGGGLIFFAIDSTPLGAVHYDSSMIFTDPMKVGDDEMHRAFRTMLAADEGSASYSFRGSRRTIVFRKSTVTGWRYALGVAEAVVGDPPRGARDDGRASPPPSPAEPRQSVSARLAAPTPRDAAGAFTPSVAHPRRPRRG